MSIFGSNYDRAGSGISKHEPTKKPFFQFWDIYGRRFWKMLELSILTFVCCIPIVTIGPAFTGMTTVLRQYALDKNSFLWHDFWKGFRQNWKQSLPIGIADVIIALSVICSMEVYPAYADADPDHSFIWYLLCAVSVGVGIIMLMMNFYIFPMIAAIDLNLKKIIKNSFFLACLALKKNLLTLLCLALVAFISIVMFYVTSVSIILFPIWTLSFAGFIIVFNSYPMIQKYVVNPYYEAQGRDNPEYDYLKPLGEEETVFNDMGGKEKPVEGKSKKKGKTIS